VLARQPDLSKIIDPKRSPRVRSHYAYWRPGPAQVAGTGDAPYPASQKISQAFAPEQVEGLGQAQVVNTGSPRCTGLPAGHGR
jgi:hypothetical protein